MSSTNSNSNTRRGSKKISRVILLVAGPLMIVAAALIITYNFGEISGEEFCPETFARREFYYHEIPLLGIQITGITRTTKTNSLETLLTTKKLVPPSTATPRWDLVFDMRESRVTSKGDASILTEYLDATDADGGLYWETWTKDNPKIAKILWPAVAAVSRKQLYIFVPDLVALATPAEDPQKLQSDMDARLAQRYGDLAIVHQELDDHETAVMLLDEALKYDPSDTSLVEAKAKSAALSDSADEPTD